MGPGHGRYPVVRARLDDPYPGVPLVTYLPPFLIHSPATGLFYTVHAMSASTDLRTRETTVVPHPDERPLVFSSDRVTEANPS